jgi:gas vesicle protein
MPKPLASTAQFSRCARLFFIARLVTANISAAHHIKPEEPANPLNLNSQEICMKFAFGFAAGLALSLILAPARDEETRRLLAQKVRELMRMPKEKAEEAAEAAKEKARDIGARIGRRADESAVEAVKNEVLGNDQTA